MEPTPQKLILHIKRESLAFRSLAEIGKGTAQRTGPMVKHRRMKLRPPTTDMDQDRLVTAGAQSMHIQMHKLKPLISVL